MKNIDLLGYVYTRFGRRSPSCTNYGIGYGSRLMLKIQMQGGGGGVAKDDNSRIQQDTHM